MCLFLSKAIQCSGIIRSFGKEEEVWKERLVFFRIHWEEAKYIEEVFEKERVNLIIYSRLFIQTVKL